MEVHCLKLETDECMELSENKEFHQSWIQAQGCKEANFDHDTQTDAPLEEQKETMAMTMNHTINC